MIRWGVYLAGVLTVAVAMTLLADVSGFDRRVGLLSWAGILGAVAATWAATTRKERRCLSNREHKGS